MLGKTYEKQNLFPELVKQFPEYMVVDLALNQAAKPWKPIFGSVGTICGGLFPKMYGGQICNLGVERIKKLP